VLMFYLNVTCGLMQVVESPHKKLKRKGIVASKKEILDEKDKKWSPEECKNRRRK